MIRFVVVVSCACFLGVACGDRSAQDPSHLLGSWRAPSGQASLEFLQNGTASVRVESPEVDRTTWYSWQRVGSDRLQLTPAATPIRQSEELPPGPIYTFHVAGEALTLIGVDGARLTYKRVREKQ